MKSRAALQIVTAGLAAPQAMAAQTHVHTSAHVPETPPPTKKSPVFFNAGFRSTGAGTSAPTNRPYGLNSWPIWNIWFSSPLPRVACDAAAFSP